MYGDYCDAEEEAMERQRGVDREREVLREQTRTLHALTVSRTLDYIFHESRYDPKFRREKQNVVLSGTF